MDLESAVIYSNNVAKSSEFYQQLGLGLKEQSDKFAALTFGNGVNLVIKKSSEDRESPGCQTVIISADNIEELFQKAQDNKLNIRGALEEKPWGKEFSAWDPDMNKVTFIKRNP